MQHLDFLSLPPSIFLMKERKGKNKLGGLFSILFALVMLFLSIYHFYIYISSSEFDLTYYRDNWLTKLSKEEKKYIREPKLLGIVFNYLSNDVKIIFLSGREEGAGQDSLSREHTIKWLESNNYKSPTLYMRKHGDFRPDDIIKAELYENYVNGKYNVIGIYDDRNKVVDMWRKLGLPCYQVYYGNF